MAETKKETNNQKRIIILLVIVIIVLVAAGGVFAFRFMNQDKPAEDGGDGTPELGYAEGTTVVRDSDALQKAVDELAEKVAKGEMVLEYDADLYSVDGTNFIGYMANAVENNYDMYFDMYNGGDLNDQIYLSGLLKPGQALNKIELKSKLDDGDHTATLFFTTVEDDHKTLCGQMAVSVTLHVGAQYANRMESGTK